jgi:hypothetical protein
MKLEEARNMIDNLMAQSRLVRQDHALLMEALNLLYSTAKDVQEENIPVSPDA